MQRRRLLQHWIWVIIGAVALRAPPARADDDNDDNDDDHERARIAREAGQIRPLAELMGRVEQRYLGRIIKVELDREDGRWVYEFRLLPPDGRVFRVELDAATGEVRRTKGPVQERRG